MPRSIVEYYAEHENYKCGYCRKADTNFAHGLWAHSMSVQDYQDLIDRGWRRSGKYCYKPTLNIICCPMYTIRCRALEFKTSKSQKKVLKRYNKYIVGQEGTPGVGNISVSSDEMKLDYCGGGEQFVESKQRPQDIHLRKDIQFIDEPNEKPNDTDKESFNPGEKCSTSNDELPPPMNRETRMRDTGPDPSKPLCKKAKHIRKERRLEKLRAQGIDINTLDDKTKPNEKQIEDFIKDLPGEIKHKLEIKLVRTNPPSAEWLASAKETHRVYVKYQMTVHGDTADKCTENKFMDFLVNSPLVEEHSERAPTCGYGSFHQQYWLDEKLIAVGVIDILPNCVSSVYFFYDPEYRSLTLGTYGALREIEFTRHLHSQSPDLKYYYMGFYIHSCRKMRYKGNFFPSDLLCPETYDWFPMKHCLSKLEVSLYARFSPNMDQIDENCTSENDINYIPILHNGQVMSYKMYKRRCLKNKGQIEGITTYAHLVGSKSAKSLVLLG